MTQSFPDTGRFWPSALPLDGRNIICMLSAFSEIFEEFINIIDDFTTIYLAQRAEFNAAGSQPVRQALSDFEVSCSLHDDRSI